MKKEHGFAFASPCSFIGMMLLHNHRFQLCARINRTASRWRHNLVRAFNPLPWRGLVFPAACFIETVVCRGGDSAGSAGLRDPPGMVISRLLSQYFRLPRCGFRRRCLSETKTLKTLSLLSGRWSLPGLGNYRTGRHFGWSGLSAASVTRSASRSLERLEL